MINAISYSVDTKSATASIAYSNGAGLELTFNHGMPLPRFHGYDDPTEFKKDGLIREPDRITANSQNRSATIQRKVVMVDRESQGGLNRPEEYYVYGGDLDQRIVHDMIESGRVLSHQALRDYTVNVVQSVEQAIEQRLQQPISKKTKVYSVFGKSTPEALERAQLQEAATAFKVSRAEIADYIENALQEKAAQTSGEYPVENYNVYAIAQSVNYFKEQAFYDALNRMMKDGVLNSSAQSLNGHPGLVFFFMMNHRINKWFLESLREGSLTKS